MGQYRREYGLDGADAKLGHVEFNVFAFLIVRVMVRHDHIDRTIGQPIPEGVNVGLRAEGRVHLQVRIEPGQIGIGEHQLMGGNIATDG